MNKSEELQIIVEIDGPPMKAEPGWVLMGDYIEGDKEFIFYRVEAFATCKIHDVESGKWLTSVMVPLVEDYTEVSHKGKFTSITGLVPMPQGRLFYAPVKYAELQQESASLLSKVESFLLTQKFQKEQQY